MTIEDKIKKRIRELKDTRSGIMDKYFIVYSNESDRQVLMSDNLKLDFTIMELNKILEFITK